MTRINVGISVRYMNKVQLLAEHNEIKRIPHMVKSGYLNKYNIPKEFTLGRGHTKFFYNKLGYLLDRYKEIYNECIARGYKVQNYESVWIGIKPELMGNYKPSIRDIDLVLNS